MQKKEPGLREDEKNFKKLPDLWFVPNQLLFLTKKPVRRQAAK